MKFKDFLLIENDNYLQVKVGEMLTALQNIYEDSGVMSKKEINDILVNIANHRIKPLLNSGNKNLYYLKSLQKIAVAIYSNAESGNDPKSLIKSCISEIQNILSGSKSVINKINKKETDGLPDSEDNSIKNNLKNSSKFLKQADQPNPATETGIDSDKAPPLSGDGQRTLNVL